VFYQLITILGALLTGVGYYFNIRKKRICFWIWIVGNLVWLSSCLIITNWGLILTNTTFIGVNFVGWRKWRKEDER